MYFPYTFSMVADNERMTATVVSYVAYHKIVLGLKTHKSGNRK